MALHFARHLLCPLLLFQTLPWPLFQRLCFQPIFLLSYLFSLSLESKAAQLPATVSPPSRLNPVSWHLRPPTSLIAPGVLVAAFSYGLTATDVSLHRTLVYLYSFPHCTKVFRFSSFLLRFSSFGGARKGAPSRFAPSKVKYSSREVGLMDLFVNYLAQLIPLLS